MTTTIGDPVPVLPCITTVLPELLENSTVPLVLAQEDVIAMAAALEHAFQLHLAADPAIPKRTHKG